MKLRGKHSKRHYAGRTQPESGRAQHHAAGPAAHRLKWVSYRADSARPRSAQQGSQHMWKHVGVFVAIDMGQSNSTRLDFAELGFHFTLNFFHANLLADCCHGKLLQAAAKAR